MQDLNRDGREGLGSREGVGDGNGEGEGSSDGGHEGIIWARGRMLSNFTQSSKSDVTLTHRSSLGCWGGMDGRVGWEMKEG